MNKETEIVILESLRMLLWENHRKWETINLQNGGGGCVETNEIKELVERINDILNPTREPTLADKTHDALSEGKNGKWKKCQSHTTGDPDISKEDCPNCEFIISEELNNTEKSLEEEDEN